MSIKPIYTALVIALSINLVSCQSSVTSQPPQIKSEQFMPKISVQLWSVKDAVKHDFEGTLKQLAKMGFQGVEFAGDFGPYKDNPQGLKTFLDSIGLQACGAHIDFSQLDASKFDSTVEFYKTIGVKLLIDPWDERSWDAEKIHEVTNELNRLAKLLEPHKMKIGYHNHDKEFNSYQADTFWDFLAQNTTKNVVLQQDVGWTVYAGKDPIDYVKRYPGRTITTHYKIVLPKNNPENYSAIIGQDMIDWLNLSKTNIAVGGTEWFVIEQETYPEGLTPMQSVAQSKLGLDNILKSL